MAGLLDDHRYQWWSDLIERVLIRIAAKNVGYVCIYKKLTQMVLLLIYMMIYGDICERLLF